MESHVRPNEAESLECDERLQIASGGAENCSWSRMARCTLTSQRLLEIMSEFHGICRLYREHVASYQRLPSLSY